MDYKLISKQHRELMEDINLILEYMGHDDWETLIKSIKREMKIKEVLQILQ